MLPTPAAGLVMASSGLLMASSGLVLGRQMRSVNVDRGFQFHSPAFIERATGGGEKAEVGK